MMQPNPYIVDYESLPAWARDSPLIRHGYRRPADGPPASAAEVAGVTSARASGTARSRRAATRPEPEARPTYRHDSLYQCWRSVWDYWHNETVNIHTHMWGGVVALLFLAMHAAGLLGALPAWWDWSFHGLRLLHPVPLPPESEAARLLHMDVRVRTQALDWHDVLGFMAFLLSAAVCLGCSATYHTVSCHSQAVARSCNRLDYIGIVVLISGSFVPVLRYAFYCQPRVHLFFTLLQLTLALVAIYFVVQPKYATPAFRPVRAGVFVLLGLSGVGPVVYVLGNYGTHFVMETIGFRYLALSGALYIIGAGIYVARVPERFSPGTFDYVGASHQIFHCFVLIAAAMHYVAVCRGYLFWHSVEVLGGSAGTGAVCAVLDTLV